MLILTSSDVISAKVKKFQARNRICLNGEPTPKIMILPWTDLIHFKSTASHSACNINVAVRREGGTGKA